MTDIVEISGQTQNDTQPSVDYGRLRNSLKAMLEQQYRAGDRIPSERTLAAEFKVSPATISRTLQSLVQSGIVRRARGSGTYLVDRSEQIVPEKPLSGNEAAGVQMPRPSLSGRTIGIIAAIGDKSSRQGEPEGVGHRIASAIEREVQSCGGATRIIDSQRHSDGSERNVLDEMLKRGIDSLILIDFGLQTSRWLPLLLEAHRRSTGMLPLVLALINDTCEWPVDCVRIDDSWGAFEATSLLLKQGHRKLAFLSPAQGDFSWADARAAAFHRAVGYWNSVYWNSMRDALASGTVLYSSEDDRAQETGWHSTSHWEALADEIIQNKSVTGIVAANDNIALQFWAMMKTKGVRVPDDISLVGYDNSIQAASADLCTLDLPAEQTGIQAVRLCRQRLENPVWDMRIEVALKPILLVRGSVQSLAHATL